MLNTRRFRQTRYLIVIAGESNAGGCSPNNLLTPDQLLPQKSLQIWNNYAQRFEPLTIGTNNLLGHAGTPDNATHGLERGLAREICHSGQWPETYLVKSGQGGSPIEPWVVGHPSGYWSSLEARFLGALTALRSSGFEVVPILIWMHGINDAVKGTSPAAFRSATESFFLEVRKLMGWNTRICFPKIMPTNSSYIAINTQIQEIADADPETWAIETAWVPANPVDPNHYTANGYMAIIRAIIDSLFKNNPAPIGQILQRSMPKNPIVMLKRVGAFSIPAGANTLIPMDTVEEDPDTMFNRILGAVVIPIECEGVYCITGAATLGPVNQTRVQITVNGVVKAQSPLVESQVRAQYSSEVTRRLRLKAGDTVALTCFQNSGILGELVPLFLQPEFQSLLQINRIAS